MKKNKLYFIVNPLSSNGKSLKVMKEIEGFLNQHNYQYEVIFTEYEGHAIKVAKNLSKNTDIASLIAVGGDGTINEVINGLYPSTIPLGFIPAGSGNDYAKHMKIPMDPITALKGILKGTVDKIDIGSINKRLFINVAGFGFDAEITRIANHSPYKKIFGKTIYIYGLFKALFTFKPFSLKIAVNGNTYELNNVWLITVANNRFFGGGMLICPNANNQDGELDVCIIKDLTPIRLILLFPSIFTGNHLRFKNNVQTLKGKHVKIKLESKTPIQADGEMIKCGETIEVIHKGLNIIK